MKKTLLFSFFGFLLSGLTTFTVLAQSQDPYLFIQLFTEENYTTGKSPHDGIGIFFNDNYNNGYDSGDAPKPLNFYENLGRNIQGIIVSIEQRKLPVPGELLELFTNGYTRSNYVLAFQVNNITSVEIYLDDAYTGTSTLVSNSNTHNFFVETTSSSPSRATDRFSIRFENLPITYTYENAQWSPQNPNGIITSKDNIVVKNGVADLNSDSFVNDIEIMGGATLNIWNALYLSGNMTIVGDMVFKSTPTSDGELASVSATSIISGEVTVEKYMQNRRAYRMVSSPVTTTTSIHDNWQEGATSNTHNPASNYGTHITGTKNDQENGFDATQTGNPSMFTVDVSNQQFIPISNTDNTTLNAGDSYLMFIRGDRSVNLTSNDSHSETTLRSKGILASGEVIQSYTALNDGDFIMFGNPYQSVVDINTVFAESNLNPNYYYIYDASIGTNGGYVTVSLPDGNNILNSSANHYLQPGMAAQVAVTQSGVTNLKFTENSKSPGNHHSLNASGNKANLSDMMIIKLYTQQNFQTNGPVHDGIGIEFDEAYSNSITSEDAPKAFNFYENIAVDKNGSYLSIEKRKFPANEEVFQLYTMGYTTDKYVLKVALQGLSEFNFYLYDAYLGTNMPITNGVLDYFFEIDFSNPFSFDSNRFSIHTESILGINSNQLQDIHVYPNPWTEGELAVRLNNLSATETSVMISDIMGRPIFSETYSFTDILIPSDSVLIPGIYFITIKTDNHAHTFKIIKK